MKIGIDCRLWNETGVGRYIRNLVLNLQNLDRKNTYTLFVLDKDNKEILNQIQNDKFKTTIADIKWHSMEEQLKFPQILNNGKLDLVHFPYFSVPIFYNKPFVVTVHDLIIDHFSTGKASTLPETVYKLKLLGYKLVLDKTIKRAKKIIAVSNATKNEIIDHLKISPQKIAVVYEGVDAKISNVKNQISNPKLKSQKYFLYVGNAFPHKNLDRLLESLKILNSDVNLVLVGKDDYFYQRLMKKVASMNLSDKVIVLHNVNDEELSNLYKNALALVAPSLMEGFGLPALEALANKCLVLSSDIPSSREVLGDAAIYFNPHDIQDMAKKMNDVYLNNIYHLSEKKERGLRRAADFSWEKTARETLKTYEGCVGL
jgi:glycosyltransferase involved in cell wall biosynthesis